MRFRFVLFNLLLGLLLPSCGKPVISSFSEASSIESVEPYIEPTGGSYDPSRTFKESVPADLRELGLKEDIDHLVTSLYRRAANRSSGVLDPFVGKKPDEIETPNPVSNGIRISDTSEYAASLFSENVYTYVPFYNASLSVASCGHSQGYYPVFYSLERPMPDIGPFAEAIYSHGCWSYVGNFYDQTGHNAHQELLTGYEIFDTSDGLSLLACLLHCTMEDYPYTVYFDKECVYFMSKDPHFPNDYIEEFNKREDMHLLSGYPTFDDFSSSYLSKPKETIPVEEIPEDVEPIGGSYDPNRSFKEKEPVDLASVGLDWEFDEEYQPISKINGSSNPFNSQTPSKVELFSSIEDPSEQMASSKALFDENIYYYIPHTPLSVDYSIYYDGSAGPGFVYYDYMSFFSRSLHTVGLAWVDAVYSHGYWSYIANCNYNAFDQTVKGNMEAIFAAVLSKGGRSFSTQFNFDIYFDEHCVYFMKHYDAFPNDYIDEFNKRDDMHLLYRYTPSDQGQAQPPRPPM